MSLESRVIAALDTVYDPELDEPITTLGFVGSCVVTAEGDVDVRLRLPRPPWRPVDVVAAALLVLTTLLVLAALGHLVAG